MNSILVLKHIMNLCGWGFKKTNRLPVKNEAVTSLQKSLISYYWNLKRNNKSYTQHQLFSFARLLPSDTAEYSSKPEYKKKDPNDYLQEWKNEGAIQSHFCFYCGASRLTGLLSHQSVGSNPGRNTRVFEQETWLYNCFFSSRGINGYLRGRHDSSGCIFPGSWESVISPMTRGGFHEELGLVLSRVRTSNSS